VILGNFVGVGEDAIELAFLLLLLRLRSPDRFVLLRGAQECSYANRLEPFFTACVRRYSVIVWREFNESFQKLPIATFVNNAILCTPAGLSPRLTDMDELNAPDGEIPEAGIVYDILFSEINLKSTDVGWADAKDPRSISFTRMAGEDVLRKINARAAVFGTKDIAAQIQSQPLATLGELYPFGNCDDINFLRVFSAGTRRSGEPCQASFVVVDSGIGFESHVF
jgi:hypothetical protein